MKSASTQTTVLLCDEEGTSAVDADFTDKWWSYRCCLFHRGKYYIEGSNRAALLLGTVLRGPTVKLC